MKERADKMLVTQGLAASRHQAHALILAGDVYAEGSRIEKPGQMLDSGRKLRLKQRMPFVSRGGLKLEAALRRFEIPVRGRIGLDLGASTGGFTDCLLQEGASHVYAVDVDPRQLDWKLVNDPRVTAIKKNARYLTSGDLPGPVDLAVMDLSFISVLKVLPALSDLLDGGEVIALIKPQFEVGKGRVGKKGVVRDPSLHFEVLTRVTADADSLGFGLTGVMRSPVLGQKGNREFLVFWRPGPTSQTGESRETQIKKAVWDEID
jgi:23S rRNA (cytidine1920-2'-O)/16S rRNA (cytidine1409-2'-O)-methyltransferase